MALAALLALTLFGQRPAAASCGAGLDTTTVADADDDDAIPPGAPTDDYGFVAWCYGAMDESILVYESVIPDLKAIDARIGSPVKEAVPYADDVAEERQAGVEAVRIGDGGGRARQPASDRRRQGAAAMEQGRSIWSQAKLQPSRQLAHAWLMWGSPDRCEATAKTLKARATLLGQAMAIDAPAVDAPPARAAPTAAAPAKGPGEHRSGARFDPISPCSPRSGDRALAQNGQSFRVTPRQPVEIAASPRSRGVNFTKRSHVFSTTYGRADWP